MVNNITALSPSGLRDWLWQRLSAIVIMSYTLVILYNCFIGDLDYYKWQALHSNPIMQIFTLLFFIACSIHAWIGMWTITTDYLKPLIIRLIFQIIIIFSAAAYILGGAVIIWG